MERREFLKNIATTTLGLGLLQSAYGKDLALDIFDETNGFSGNLLRNTGAVGKVVVVGGGMAGTTAAKYLRFWGGTGVEVTLVEPNATYYSNIFSNMVLVEEKTLGQLAYNYNTIRNKYGVRFINDSVFKIDTGSNTVMLKSGSILPYDRLVIAPGIDFEPIAMSGSATAQSKIVHAWKAGTQTTSLQAQIKAMTKQDTFILTIPPKPYRCPPGPYERACVIADYLKRKKGGGKVIILDANSGIQAAAENFKYAFENTHKSVITYIPNATLYSIDADMNTVNTSVGTFKGKVINAIPTHKAGSLITQSGIGLANAGNGKWAGVNVLSYESTAVPNIHIIGDASSTTQPKAGHIANAEAKVCADAIIQLLKGDNINDSPMTNSACFTPITKSTAAWLSVAYRYNPITKTMDPTGSGVTESLNANADNYDQMLKWFSNLMSDTFA
jgi:NADPH-dependent 2,4-dienoyl-CoA reductase/sulfur reductase-like enzyme